MDNREIRYVVDADLKNLLTDVKNLLLEVSEKLDNRRFTVEQAAEELGVSKRTLYNIMKDGLIEFTAGKGGRRISQSAINDYLQSIEV